MLQKFLHSEHVSEHDIVICWPASEVQGEGSTLEERKQSTEQLDKGIVSFYRKVLGPNALQASSLHYQFLRMAFVELVLLHSLA